MRMIFYIAAAMMFFSIASAAFAEPPVLAGRLCRTFEYEEDEVDAIIQFRMIGGELFVEQSGLAYWAAIISPDEPSMLVLASAPDVCIGATARRWSGFSMDGEFWDDGVRTEIALAADDTLTLRFGDDEPITARPCASVEEMHDPAKFAEQLPGHLDLDGRFLGRWTSDDGTVSASFGETGRATVIMRRHGEPPKVCFCIYGQSGPSNVEIIGERLGWGGQPYEMSGELLSDGSLWLRDDGMVLLKKMESF